MQTLKRIADIIAAIAIIFLFPLLYFGQKQDSMIRSLVSLDTSSFLEEIRGKGYLTADRYDSFLGELAKTGLSYDVNMKLKQGLMEPEYRFRPADEVIGEQNGAYTGSNEYHYYPVSTDIPTVTEPDNSGLTMNDETNESILAGASGTPAAPGHVHTPACYAGHVHTGTPYFTHTHAHNRDGFSCRRYIERVMHDVNCRNCGAAYRWTVVVYYWDNGLITGHVDTNPITYCLECNSRNISVSSQINNYAYSCYYDIDEDNDGFYDEVPNGVYKNYTGLSQPQSSVKTTYTSGCYTFHNTKYLSDSYERYAYGGLISSSARNAFMKMFRTDNFAGYCKIPLYYRIGITHGNYYDTHDFYITDNPSLVYAEYKAFPDTGGSIKFRYQGYWKNGEAYQSNNPGFPEVIDIAALKNLYGNVGAMNNLFKNAIGKNYNSMYGGNIETFIGWYTGTLINETTEYLDTCDFNHSLGVNRWITTCGQEEDARLVCSQKAVSIVPTHPVQAVYTGENLITTVVVTYLDGSTNVVPAATAFSTSNPVSNQTVTLEYTAATGQKVTCTIQVSVIPRRKTCGNGHTYNLNNDGTDPGCPYCKAWLRSLTIRYPASGRITIYKGTSLPDNGVELLATYLDGHTERVAYGYADNLDSAYVGTQNVTVSYKGKNVTLTVITKRNLIQCPVCHSFYELYPDGTDPGCPYCAARTPIFTGNVMKYYNEKYTEEILYELYEVGGTFYFTDGDYFTIEITDRGKGLGRSLLSHLYGNMDDAGIRVIRSGYIRDDAR